MRAWTSKARGKIRPPLATCMTSPEPSQERLEIDVETWSKRDLIQVISSRYFILGDPETGEFSWRVNAIGGDTESECLIRMNKHLEKLGMIGLLDRGNPPILTVTNLPNDVFVMPRWQQAVIWIAMFSFMTIAGSGLILRNDPSLEFNAPLLAKSCTHFSLPLIASVFLASEVRRRVANRYGVSIGHLSPLAFPLSEPIWPFGLAGFISQRRSDQVPIPNRKALGLISISSPLVMFISGILLTILGISYTSIQPPDLESPPVAFSGNVIVGILESLGIVESLEVRLQWLDPIAIAGLGLCTVSWIMMLPIPGFPGDHLLHSILGPDNLLSDDKQTAIFASTLIFMVLIFATDPWFPWLVIATIAVWRRFSPTPILDPFVVDESSGLDDISRNQFVTVIAMVMILAFPGVNGSYSITEWDEGIETSQWPSEVVYTVGEETIIPLAIAPEGVVPVSGWIQFRIEGSVSQLDLSSDCSETEQTCRVDGITQSENSMINLILTEESSLILDNMTASIRVFTEITGHYDEHVITLIPNHTRYQANSLWDFSGTLQDPQICTVVTIGDDSIGNVSVANPRWSIINGTTLSKGNNHICLEGVNGASISGPIDYLGRHLGPLLYITWDDGNSSSWQTPIVNSSTVINSKDGIIRVPREFSGSTIGYVESTSPFCPSQSDFPAADSDTSWNRTLGDYSFIQIPETYSGNGSLLVKEGGWLVICEDYKLTSSFKIANGPQIWVSPGALYNGVKYTTTSVIEITNFQNETELITISISAPPGDTWGIESPESIMSNSSVNVTLNLPESGYEAVVWVIPDDSGTTLFTDIREVWK